jgi:type I restriction enzyme S subunit
MGNIQGGEVVAGGSGGLDEVPKGLLLEHHDLLFTRTNGNPDLVGKVGLFRGSATEHVTFASYLVRLRVRSPFDPRWFHFLLNSSRFWAFARSHALVNLQTNLNSTRYVQFKVPVPPAAEQKRIADWIEHDIGQLVDATASTRREIDFFREYRNRLIADVVTGKLDVRKAAARLPDEPDEPGTLDEADALSNVDEETEVLDEVEE